MTDQRLELKIGAPVYTKDGRYGTLDKVVVDPRTRHVTHLVVRKGWLLTEDRVIPVEQVERAEPDGIYLDAVAEELNQNPLYREETFVTPLEDWEAPAPYTHADTLFWAAPYVGVVPPVVPVIEHRIAKGVPAGEIVLRRGVSVFYNGEEVGSLDHILIDPASGRLTHLVVRAENDPVVIVPAEWVRELYPEAIELNHWNPDQPGIPSHQATRDDDSIARDLLSRFKAIPALSAVEAQVERGVAHLFGNVRTIADKAEADAIARNTPGVIDVENKLSPDSALFGVITAALATDSRTALIPIEVIVDRGVVTLKGTVPSPEVKAAAEAIARKVPGVVTVINELEVKSEDHVQKVRFMYADSE